MKKAVVVVVAAAAVVLVALAFVRGRGTQDGSLGTRAARLSGAESFAEALQKEVSVDTDRSPGSERLSVQYAVIAVCEAAGVPYQWQKSASLADPERTNWTDAVHIRGVTAQKAISDILSPVGLTFDVDENGLYLHK